jgi:hypothetical protein
MEQDIAKAKTTGLNFGDALNVLKGGDLVARSGWNGNGMYLIWNLPQSIAIENVTNTCISSTLKAHNLEHLSISGHIDMWTAQKQLSVGWRPTNIDMEANDWFTCDISGE